MKLNDRVYEILKWLVLICIPACTTAYVAIRAAVDEAFAKAIEYGEPFRQVRTIPAPDGLRIDV